MLMIKPFAGTRPRARPWTETFGNGDGIVDPGEQIALRIYVKNKGSGLLGPLSAELTSGNSIPQPRVWS